MIQCKQKVIKDGLFETAQGLGGEGQKVPFLKAVTHILDWRNLGQSYFI